MHRNTLHPCSACTVGTDGEPGTWSSPLGRRPTTQGDLSLQSPRSPGLSALGPRSGLGCPAARAWVHSSRRVLQDVCTPRVPLTPCSSFMEVSLPSPRSSSCPVLGECAGRRAAFHGGHVPGPHQGGKAPGDPATLWAEDGPPVRADTPRRAGHKARGLPGSGGPGCQGGSVAGPATREPNTAAGQAEGHVLERPLPVWSWTWPRRLLGQVWSPQYQEGDSRLPVNPVPHGALRSHRPGEAELLHSLNCCPWCLHTEWPGARQGLHGTRGH